MIYLCTAWFNTRGGARRLIESVRNQTFQDWKWCVSIDTTTPDSDGLAAILKAAEEDKRIIIKQQPVSTAPYIGAAKSDAARLIEDVEGWCAWVDADDWLELNAIAEINAYGVLAEQQGKKWMISQVWEEFEDGTRGCRMAHPKMDDKMLIAQAGGLPHMEVFRIECLLKEPYDRQLTCGEDWDLHLRFWTKWDAPLWIPKPLYHYRYGVGQYDQVATLESLNRVRAKIMASAVAIKE
jgi:hypothetical protein